MLICEHPNVILYKISERSALRGQIIGMGHCRCLTQPSAEWQNSGSSILPGLFLRFLFGFGFPFSFLCGYGLSFCSTDFRKERLGYGRSRHLA
jgi:hypothetical protein